MEKTETIGPISYTYDAQGRPVRVECITKDYNATLDIEYDRNYGKFSNNKGDTSVWENGAEHTDSTYGTWEQATTEAKTLDEWVQKWVVIMQSAVK